MKTMLMMVMAALLLSGCGDKRVKSDAQWLDEIKTAGGWAGWHKEFCMKYPTDPTKAIDYLLARQRVERIKEAAVADGLDADAADASDVFGGYEGAEKFRNNDKKDAD